MYHSTSDDIDLARLPWSLGHRPALGALVWLPAVTNRPRRPDRGQQVSTAGAGHQRRSGGGGGVCGGAVVVMVAREMCCVRGVIGNVDWCLVSGDGPGAGWDDAESRDRRLGCCNHLESCAGFLGTAQRGSDDSGSLARY